MVGHSTKQMKHGRWWDIWIWCDSTSCSSYLNVTFTTCIICKTHTRTGWVTKSKLLILSVFVNKTNKIGWTWTNTNSYRENEKLSDISRKIYYVTTVLCLCQSTEGKQIKQVTHTHTHTFNGPIKIWVVGYWRGYLSGARCRLTYGPADATATHCLYNPDWFYLSGTG